MLPSHFFPKNCNPRRTVVLHPRNRNTSMGIHGNQHSTQKNAELHQLNQTQIINRSSYQVRQHKSLNLNNIGLQKQAAFFQQQQKLDKKQILKIKSQKRTLFVKGICQQPILHNKTKLENDIQIREVITSNSRRFKKKLRNDSFRIKQQIYTQPLQQKTRLTKRRSRQLDNFKGWEFLQDEFCDFLH